MSRILATINREIDDEEKRYCNVIVKHYEKKDLRFILSIIQAGGAWNYCNEFQVAAERCSNRKKELIDERYIAKGIGVKNEQS